MSYLLDSSGPVSMSGQERVQLVKDNQVLASYISIEKAKKEGLAHIKIIEWTVLTRIGHSDKLLLASRSPNKVTGDGVDVQE
ncbi:unnamed protein product, partial [Iphiclides podalirius]